MLVTDATQNTEENARLVRLLEVSRATTLGEKESHSQLALESTVRRGLQALTAAYWYNVMLYAPMGRSRPRFDPPAANTPKGVFFPSIAADVPKHRRVGANLIYQVSELRFSPKGGFDLEQLENGRQIVRVEQPQQGGQLRGEDLAEVRGKGTRRGLYARGV